MGAGAILLCLALPLPAGAGPEFAPELSVTAAPQRVDRPSKLVVEVFQEDLEPHVRDHRLEIPAGWRFAVAGITPSALQSCADAASPGNPNYSSANVQASQNMEAVGLAQIALATDDTRDPGSRTHTENVFPPQAPNIGDATQDPETADDRYVSEEGAAFYDGGGPRAASGETQASLWFLRWDPDTATAILCGTVRTPNQRIPTALREIIFQIELTLRLDGSWLMRFDFDAVPGAEPGFRSVTDNQDFEDLHVSVNSLRFTLSEVTSGTFNENCPGDAEGTCRVTFSQTPQATGNYSVLGGFSTCPADASGCSGTEIIRTVALPIFNGEAFAHPSGALTGPGAATQIPTGFGVVHGSDSIAIPWRPAPRSPVEVVKGYVLVIARPHDEPSRHFEYLVTDPSDPAFDARQPCGADGEAEECALTLSFPLGSGTSRLRGDGKYEVALITVFRDGHRTDGRCDDGTGPGIPCGAGLGGARIAGQGVSLWEVFISPDTWDQAFVEVNNLRPTGTSPIAPAIPAPAFLLLVSFEDARGEFVVWHPGGHTERFTATSGQILELVPGGGIVSFGSSTIVGHQDNWRFDGFVFPETGLAQQPEPVCERTQLVPTGSPVPGQACGIFVVYSTRGAPDNPPNGIPTVALEVFEGARVTAPESGT